jgi:hypothetical protein
MHRTSRFDALLPCFTYELHAQSRQLRRFRHLIGQLPVTLCDRRPDLWVSSDHITYSMCKFHHSISIPKGSLQTRIPIQDTCFGHFDPPVGSLPVTPGGRWVDVWVSRSQITYSMCKFHHSISIPKGSLQTRILIHYGQRICGYQGQFCFFSQLRRALVQNLALWGAIFFR